MTNSYKEVLAIVLIFFLILISSSSMASSFQSCPSLFYKPVSIQEDKNVQELCNNKYAVLYSNLSRTPLFSYEKSDPSDSSSVKRSSTFKEDVRVPDQYRSTLNDYRNTGYDKGHLTPSGDMPTLEDQQSTFLLSNIAPQIPKLNQQSWRVLEASVKHFPYKVTGVVFEKDSITKINNVLVPDYFYKIVTDGSCTESYLAENIQDGKPYLIDNQALLNKVGYNFNFPLIQCDIK